MFLTRNDTEVAFILLIPRDLCDELVRTGHRVVVVTSQYADLAASETVNGVEIHRVPVFMRSSQAVASLPSMLSYGPSAIKVAGALHREKAFDLVSTHFAIPTGPAGYKVARTCDLPNVLSIYGGDIYDPIDVIPLAIHPNSHGKRSRKELGLNEDDLIITTLGRLINRKKVFALVYSVAALPREVPARLLIMGEGPQKEVIEQEAKKLGIADRVELLGRVSDAQNFKL